MSRQDANLTNGRITTLPKWAQKLIGDLQRDVEQATEVLTLKFDGAQEEMETWMDHVIYEDIFQSSRIPNGKRIINASQLTFLTRSELKVTVRPNTEYVDIDFDCHNEMIPLIEPRATNRIRIVGAANYTRRS